MGSYWRLSCCALAMLAAQEQNSSTEPHRSPLSGVVAVVNGASITETDLLRSMQIAGVPAEQRNQLRDRFLKQLIDKRLILEFLQQQKTEARRQDVDEQIARLRKLAGQEGDDPDKVLAARGYTEQTLRAEISLSLAWKRHLARVVTDSKIREYYNAHRRELDGTTVRAAHIIIKLDEKADDEAFRNAEAKLQRIATEIRAGKEKFAAAARRNSDGPSKNKGGDLGSFTRHGTMPEAMAREAFSLKSGEVSNPFRTKFGVHILTVTDIKPGELSVEDVRKEITSAISKQLWRDTAQAERSRAKVEILRSSKR